MLVAQSCLTLRPHGLQPTRLLRPWDSPGKNTGVGCHFLLQGIFLTQRSNLGLLRCLKLLNPVSHQGSQKYVSANGKIILSNKARKKEKCCNPAFQWPKYLQQFCVNNNDNVFLKPVTLLKTLHTEYIPHVIIFPIMKLCSEKLHFFKSQRN